MKHLHAIVLLLMLMPTAWSVGKILPFPQQKMEANYEWLTNNLRCQKCANQTLADSQSDLASDLKQRVYKLVLTGKSKEQIVDYLIQRFGDRVAYDPPFRTTTAILWILPVFLLVIGLLVMIRAIHNRQKSAVSNSRTLNEYELQRLEQLLGNETTTNNSHHESELQRLEQLRGNETTTNNSHHDSDNTTPNQERQP